MQSFIAYLSSTWKYAVSLDGRERRIVRELCSRGRHGDYDTTNVEHCASTYGNPHLCDVLGGFGITVDHYQVGRVRNGGASVHVAQGPWGPQGVMTRVSHALLAPVRAGAQAVSRVNDVCIDRGKPISVDYLNALMRQPRPDAWLGEYGIVGLGSHCVDRHDRTDWYLGLYLQDLDKKSAALQAVAAHLGTDPRSIRCLDAAVLAAPHISLPS